MGILVVGGVLFGIILGQLFECFVLIPACGLASILILAISVHTDYGILGWFVQIIAVFTSLQIGYVVGLVGWNLPLAPKRSKDLCSGRHNETRSSVPDTFESGRKSA